MCRVRFIIVLTNDLKKEKTLYTPNITRQMQTLEQENVLKVEQLHTHDCQNVIEHSTTAVHRDPNNQVGLTGWSNFWMCS